MRLTALPEIWPKGGCASTLHEAHWITGERPSQEVLMAEQGTQELTAPDTIVLVHGFWVTPRSWEGWIAHYEARGFRVLAPAYPGLEVEVEALNADPTPIERLTVESIMASLESVVGALADPPILIG